MTPSQDQIMEAVQAFITADSWAKSKQIVEAMRDVLLTDAADDYLATLLAQNEADEDVIGMLEAHRTLLLRCRHEGIDAAFADLLGPIDQAGAIPQPVVEAVLAFINATSLAESKQMVEIHADLLLTDAADTVLNDLLAQYRDDENATRRLEGARVRCWSAAAVRGSKLLSLISR